MIRVDEIYNHTFWPWIKNHLPLTRLFFLDPFGSTDPNDLKNFGHDITEHNYIFMHDQEPIDLALHRDLFDQVYHRNVDLDNKKGPRKAAVIVSEIDSDNLAPVCSLYGWQPFYYFFHGWASLDWYRGYDKTFLATPVEQRQITHSFLSPNRIIGGQRDHRLLLIYHLLRQKVQNALISCPNICPQENQSLLDLAAKHVGRYPDILHEISKAGLPWHFPQETGHPMTSCWLDLWQESASCLTYVITETVYFGRRSHITEKTFKPICLGMPFVMVSAKGSLRYLRKYGFKTFGEFWDETYDDISNDFERLERVAQLLGDLDRLPQKQKQSLFEKMIPTIQHNHQHFYGGSFERLLWQEFQGMLNDLLKYMHS